MTFTEAAEAVLRKTGKPLHYKKITQMAIEQNLLSHVGKTPEVTMSTRLATLAKKDRGEAAIVRVKPGIFGLRDWGAAAADAATEEGDADEPTNGEGAAAGDREDAMPPEEDEAPTPSSLEERERAQRLVAAQNLFPEEADDNDPVMAEKPAPVVPAATAAGEAGAATDAGRRRRRRRRRGRGGDRPEGGAPGSAQGELGVEGAGDLDGDDAGDDFLTPEEAAEEASREGGAEGAPVEGEMRQSAEGAPALSGDDSPATEPAPGGRGGVWRDGRGDRPRDDRGGREGGRDDRGPRGEDRGRDDRGPRDDRQRDARPPLDEVRDANFREEIGRDAADLLVSMLTRREDRQPMQLRAIVDDAIRAGKISGEPSLLMPTLAAAARADAVRREQRGERPRLRIANGRVGLIDWALGPDLVRAEADALATLERLRDAARRQLIRRLNELPQSSFTELVVLLLERMGISSLRTARRPGLPQGEIHLAGIARRANEEIKVAVLIKRGGEVGRERVIELRGSLHHYGPAVGSWIITTGNVLSGAREEAAQAGTAPVALIDGVGLGRLFDEYAVGVKHATVNIPYVDLDLFDALRNS